MMFKETGVAVVLSIELERETDGRWIAEVIELPGVLAYGTTRDKPSRTSKHSPCGWSPTVSKETRRAAIS